MGETGENARFSWFQFAIFAGAVWVLSLLLVYALGQAAAPCEFSQSLGSIDEPMSCSSWCRAQGFAFTKAGSTADNCVCVEKDGTFGAIRIFE